MAGFTGKKQIGKYLVTFKNGVQTSKIFNAVNTSTQDLRATTKQAAATGTQKLSPKAKAKARLAAKKKAYTPGFGTKIINIFTGSK